MIYIYISYIYDIYIYIKSGNFQILNFCVRQNKVYTLLILLHSRPNQALLFLVAGAN